MPHSSYTRTDSLRRISFTPLHTHARQCVTASTLKLCGLASAESRLIWRSRASSGGAGRFGAEPGSAAEPSYARPTDRMSEEPRRLPPSPQTAASVCLSVLSVSARGGVAPSSSLGGSHSKFPRLPHRASASGGDWRARRRLGRAEDGRAYDLLTGKGGAIRADYRKSLNSGSGYVPHPNW